MKTLWSAFFAASLLALPVQAQDPVKWTLGSSRSLTVAPGSVTPIKFTAKIENGWRVYSLTQAKGGPYAMTISMVEGSRATIAGQVISPAPASSYDSSFKMITETYSGTAPFTVSLRAPTEPGTYSSTIKVRYQACSARFCLPPKNALFQLTFEVK